MMITRVGMIGTEIMGTGHAQILVDRINGMSDDTSHATAHDGLVASAVAEAVIMSMHTGGVATPVAIPEV
mgnify:CR=1 FL=1|jgi:hypothetical protein